MQKEKLEIITKLFEGKEIRSVWDSKKEDYYFSVIDIIQFLNSLECIKIESEIEYWIDGELLE